MNANPEAMGPMLLLWWIVEGAGVNAKQRGGTPLSYFLPSFCCLSL